MQFTHQYGPAQLQTACHLCLGRIFSDKNIILPLLHGISRFSRPIRFQQRQVKFQCHAFFLSRQQKSRLRKRRQALLLFLQMPGRTGGIYLHHFPAGYTTRISYVHPDDCPVSLQRDLLCAQRETGIGKAVAKAVSGLDAKGIKVAVAYVDSFLIFFFIQVAVIVAKLLTARIVRVGIGPGVGQPAAGIYLPAEDICQCVAALHARLRQIHHRRYSQFLHKGKVDDPSRVQNGDGLVIQGCNVFQFPVFRVGQIIVSLLHITVSAFPGDPADHIDCRVRIPAVLGRDRLSAWSCHGICRMRLV